MMHYIDDVEMKICFIYELLKSIRMDFDEKDALEERRNLALNFTKSIVRYYHHKSKKITKNSKDFLFVKKMEKDMKTLLKTISHFECGKTDGRYFRDTFPNGYQGMLEYFNIEKETL